MKSTGEYGAERKTERDKEKEGRPPNETTITRRTTCDSKKEGRGGNNWARASHRFCGFPGPHRSTFPPTPPRESLAPAKGFLNHRWRLQVLHLSLVLHVSHGGGAAIIDKNTERFLRKIPLSMQGMMWQRQEI